MECTIFRRGVALGTMSIEEDGLYWLIVARIPREDVPVRLYCPQKLGVFVPEGGQMVLRRRISRRELPVPPKLAAALTERELQWSPEADGLRRRCTPQGVELAVRVQGQTPMTFPAAPERLELTQIGDMHYLCSLQPYVT